MHGANGISQKGQQPEQTSHYYSLTRLHTTGSVEVGDTSMTVEGVSWMDHEFGSGDLADHLVGWDWFSLQLDNNHEIMAYGLRRADSTFDPASSGTLVFPRWIFEVLLSPRLADLCESTLEKPGEWGELSESMDIGDSC